MYQFKTPVKATIQEAAIPKEVNTEVAAAASLASHEEEESSEAKGNDSDDAKLMIIMQCKTVCSGCNIVGSYEHLVTFSNT